MIISYLKYLFTAGNLHGLHSPFVYDLYDHVVREQKHYYAYDVMESLRARLLLSDDVIETLDFGTGSEQYPVRRPVRFIASRFASPRKCAQLLFRLVNHFRPQYILEVGTSLGITTGYLAMANTASSVTTLEGCPETARLAEANFKLLKIPNITVRVGEFNHLLPDCIESLPRIDFAYLDGNHRREPTMDYFHRLMTKMPENGTIVLDDIHWSKGMEQAWEEIRNDARVTTSIDLFHMGMLFFRKGHSREHFVLKF